MKNRQLSVTDEMIFRYLGDVRRLNDFTFKQR